MSRRVARSLRKLGMMAWDRRPWARWTQATWRYVKILAGREPPLNRDVRVPIVRLGSDYGGWYIAPKYLQPGSTVYSFGVGTDISFDLALIERYHAEVFAFDPTPISIEWVRGQGLPDDFKFHELGIASYDGEAAFELPEGHAVSYTLLGSDPAPGSVIGSVRRLRSIMAELSHERVHVLKLDIEGAEYDVIPDLATGGVPADQILVEFHHRLDGRAAADTLAAVETLRGLGFLVYKVSPTGQEVSLIHRSVLT